MLSSSPFMLYELPIVDFEDPNIYVWKSGDIQQTKWYTQKMRFMIRIVCIKLQSYSLCYRQTKWYMQKIPCVKTITYVCNRFNTSFCFTDHKTYQAISCYTLLHQATRGEGKNSSRKPGDFLVCHRDAQIFFFIILP